LEEIKGIGPKTRDELLNKLKSVKKISQASEEELTAIVGQAKAKIIFTHFHGE
jgi:excinuclease ABC subunit C